MIQLRRKHPYEDFAATIKKPARYVGGEYGEVVKPWGSVAARMALAFPDTYEIGMSHLGYKILYSLLAKQPRILAERVYAPWPDMEAALRERDLPLCTLESGRALAEFDVVGFSLQFELTYTNVLQMLDLGGIPLRSADRGEGVPLVIAGGPTATHPEPLAPFVDAFVIGDGEEKLPELLLADAAWREEGVTRGERLRRWATLGGVYVPALYATRIDPRTDMTVVGEPLAEGVPARVQRALVEDLGRFPFPADGPVASTETVFDRVSVEIARGCTEGCRFCQAGMIYRPVRERDPDSIVKTVTDSIREGGYDEVSLTSLSTADQSCISPLVERVMKDLEPANVSLGVSSLRAYGLGEEVLDDLARVRASGLTFAPEAGTQRMRDVINKNVTEEQLMETASRVFSRGWQKMKLYFMIGLPTETDEDVRGIVETGGRAAAVGSKVMKARRPTVTVSVSTHVPKPHTPFQWAAVDPLAEVERKQGLLRELARPNRVDLRTHDARGSVLEAVFARGDRTVGEALEIAYRLGCRFDSWDEHLRFDLWQQAFARAGIDVGRFLGTLPLDAVLPWDHIDVGLEDGFLAREYKKALRSRLSPPCGKPAGEFIHATNLRDAHAESRKLVCYDCGVACDMTRMRTERIDYLVQLGAHEPRAPRAQAPRPRPTVPPALSQPRGETFRYRLVFEKTGAYAFTSHLDLVRNLPRVFRRAGIAMQYSQGFHPKPRMAMSPALSLGIFSHGEILDIALATHVDPGALPARLTAMSPEGLRFTRARFLGPQDPSIGRVLVAARYFIAIPAAQGVAAPAVEARLQAFAHGEPLSFTRTDREQHPAGWTGAAEKVVDLGRWIESISVAPASRAAELGIAGNVLGLELRLAIAGSGGARPSDVVGALAGPGVSALVVRLGFEAAREGGPRTDPLDLEALRAAPAGVVEASPG